MKYFSSLNHSKCKPNKSTRFLVLNAFSIGGDHSEYQFTNSAENKSEPDREIWALFEAKRVDATTVRWQKVDDPKNADLFSTRIFGHKRVAVLLIHLDTPTQWDVKYRVTITRKTPAPFQHALDLASAVVGGAGPLQRSKVKHIWGARMMLVKYTASDILVKVNAVTGNASRHR